MLLCLIWALYFKLFLDSIKCCVLFAKYTISIHFYMPTLSPNIILSYVMSYRVCDHNSIKEENFLCILQVQSKIFHWYNSCKFQIVVVNSILIELNYFFFQVIYAHKKKNQQKLDFSDNSSLANRNYFFYFIKKKNTKILFMILSHFRCIPLYKKRARILSCKRELLNENKKKLCVCWRLRRLFLSHSSSV